MEAAMMTIGAAATTSPILPNNSIRLPKSSGSALRPCRLGISLLLRGTIRPAPGIFLSAVHHRNNSSPRLKVSPAVVQYMALDTARTKPSKPPIIPIPIPCSTRPAAISTTPGLQPRANQITQRNTVLTSSTRSDWVLGYRTTALGCASDISAEEQRLPPPLRLRLADRQHFRGPSFEITSTIYPSPPHVNWS